MTKKGTRSASPPPRATDRSAQPFSEGRSPQLLSEGRSPRPQADGDPDFAGDRSAAAEDIAQTDAPENGGWSGAEDNVEKRRPGTAAATTWDPHHRGDRRS